MYFGLPNSRTVSNKRTGCDFFQKIISAQYLINAQAIDKKNKFIKVKNSTGLIFSQKLVNAQYLISTHRAEIFLKINKQTRATIIRNLV